MLTGINFSPPLYFLLNYVFHLIFTTTIELLRLQSLLWTIVGIIFSFLLAQRLYGLFHAYIATILVATQSALLLSQSLEARHYSMFFACGAFALFTQGICFRREKNKSINFLNFFSHLCLSQVHYLGIIFSGMLGLSHLFYSNDKNFFKRIPSSVVFAWLLTISTNVFLLTQQSSHLGDWPKPNGLSDLFSIYNQSLIWLFILFPILPALLFGSKFKKTPTQKDEKSVVQKLILTSVVLWMCVPAFFWILSCTTDINLFVERYFIPKEAALIILLAWLFKKLFVFNNAKHLNCSCIAVAFICLLYTGINVKRFAYSLNPEHNYHHKLLVGDYKNTLTELRIFKDDASYFPNNYLNNGANILELDNKELLIYYQNFSKNIHVKLAFEDTHK